MFKTSNFSRINVSYLMVSNYCIVATTSTHIIVRKITIAHRTSENVHGITIREKHRDGGKRKDTQTQQTIPNTRDNNRPPKDNKSKSLLFRVN